MTEHVEDKDKLANALKPLASTNPEDRKGHVRLNRDHEYTHNAPAPKRSRNDISNQTKSVSLAFPPVPRGPPRLATAPMMRPPPRATEHHFLRLGGPKMPYQYSANRRQWLGSNNFGNQLNHLLQGQQQSQAQRIAYDAMGSSTRGSYKCSRCGLPKKGHKCKFEVIKQAIEKGIQCEMDPCGSLRVIGTAKDAKYRVGNVLYESAPPSMGSGMSNATSAEEVEKTASEGAEKDKGAGKSDGANQKNGDTGTSKSIDHDSERKVVC